MRSSGMFGDLCSTGLALVAGMALCACPGKPATQESGAAIRSPGTEAVGQDSNRDPPAGGAGSATVTPSTCPAGQVVSWNDTANAWQCSGDPGTVALQGYKQALTDGGDKGQCEQAVAQVRAAMAKDERLSSEKIRAEINRYERVTGPMPYPSPGTACCVFGFPETAKGALEDRLMK
jgi:hypothetical protein